MEAQMAPVHVPVVRLENILHFILRQDAIFVLQGSFQWLEFVVLVLLVCTLRFGELLYVQSVKLEHSPQRMGPQINPHAFRVDQANTQG
jgi:hypothetical protein